LLAAAVFGASRALFGIHTMHASSHFALTHKPWVWQWMDWLCFDIFMGGSSHSWNFQHVIDHHQHTNVYQADPDLPQVPEGDMRRLMKYQKPAAHYRYQAYYLPILYAFLSFKTRVYDVQIIFGEKLNGMIHMNFTMSDKAWLVATKVLFLWYQFYVPLFVFGLPWWSLLKCYVVAEIAAGMWLAYFFQVNHISDHIRYSSPKTASQREWAALQIEGTVDYAHDSWLFTFLSGTLNFQVVHHLFPSIASHHYPAITEITKRLCKKHKIKYNYADTFGQAFWLHLKELDRMGKMGEAPHDGF